MSLLYCIHCGLIEQNGLTKSVRFLLPNLWETPMQSKIGKCFCLRINWNGPSICCLLPFGNKMADATHRYRSRDSEDHFGTDCREDTRKVVIPTDKTEASFKTLSIRIQRIWSDFKNVLHDTIKALMHGLYKTIQNRAWYDYKICHRCHNSYIHFILMQGYSCHSDRRPSCKSPFFFHKAFETVPVGNLFKESRN